MELPLELCTTHEQYKGTLEDYVNTHRDSIPEDILTAMQLFAHIDLTLIHSILAKKYSIHGPESRDPIPMFRAILLMFFLQYPVRKFVSYLKTEMFRVACGFVASPPGIGTFYDYFKRLWDLPRNNISVSHVRKKKKRPKKPKIDGEKADPVEPESVDSRIDRLNGEDLSDKEKTPFLTLLTIFVVIFLAASIQMGIVSGKLLSGDGTPLVTSNRERSRRYCPGNIKGNHICKCKGKDKSECPYRSDPSQELPCESGDFKDSRDFSQPDTDTGYDSSRKCYYVGFDLYFITDAESDLPLFAVLDPASMHDSHGFAETFMRFITLMHDQFSPEAVILDSAHDVDAIYEWLHSLGIGAIIDLNKRGTDNANLPDGFKQNDQGIPVCPKGKQMTQDGVNLEKDRAVFRCPALRPDATGKLVCTCDTPCCKCNPTNQITIPLSILPSDCRTFKKALRTGFTVGPNGVPVCPEGHEMIPFGENTSKFRCPLMAESEDGTPICNCAFPCSNAKRGRIVSLKPFTNKDNISKEKDGKGYVLRKDGVPICSAGLPMKSNGVNLQRDCALFRCPLVHRKPDGTTECTCPHALTCSSNTYGKNVCIPRENNLRYYTSPPRGSKEFTKLYNKRTSSERVNKAMKEDRGLGKCKYRSTMMWYIATYVNMMLMHGLRQLRFLQNNSAI